MGALAAQTAMEACPPVRGSRTFAWDRLVACRSDTPSSTRPYCFGRVGGVSGHELDGLPDVAVGAGGADPEASCEVGVGLSAAEVSEGM